MAGVDAGDNELRFVKEFVEGLHKLEGRLTKDVKAMCNFIVRLDGLCQRLPEDLKAPLRKHFRDIYRSLRFHMMFHRVPDHDLQELRELGRLELLQLTDEEMGELPDLFCAIDPGSKILEIVSELMDTPEAPKGSQKHADNVMTTVKDILRDLPKKNRFKPHVLAMVSCGDRWSIGSSIAVSPYVRPFCLNRRINDFKLCLKKAVISFKPLDVAVNQNWSSSAVSGKDYKTRKAPCKNCRMIFKNLRGFIHVPCNDDKVQGQDTFLAACAEYCPVDQLLDDDVEVMTEFEKAALEKNRERCVALFEQFERAADELIEAYNSNDDEQQRKVFRQEKHILHIFGFKPEYNDQF